MAEICNDEIVILYYTLPLVEVEVYYVFIVIFLVIFVIILAYQLVAEHTVDKVTLSTNDKKDVLSLMKMLEAKGYKVKMVDINVAPFNVTLELEKNN